MERSVMDNSSDELRLDKFSRQLHSYLLLAHSSALLVSEADKANLNILLTMLGGLDKDILDAYYGLFGETVKPVEQLALKYRVTQDALREIISKDLHRLSISPEWQMVMRRMKPIVQRKIGFAI
ncbi:MAG: RNA polymerase subunit sigma [Prevotella sp.]|nr:RNA polymerase subunit sigma [Prevotella sp.]